MSDPSTTPTPADTGDADGPQEQQSGRSATDRPGTPPRRRGMTGTAKSMVISMIVVLAVCLVWLAMVPRVSSVTKPVQDVGGIAREVSHAQHWDVAVATGLPQEWQPTNVHLLKPDKKPRTWQAGYAGPDSAYAAVKQTKGGDAAWVSDQVGGGDKVGTQTIDGVRWTKYEKTSNSQLSLVRSEPLGGLSTVVTGTADWDQLVMFAKALVPYHSARHSLSAPATGGS